MNERIKELAEQAGIKINERRPALDDEPDGYLESDKDFILNNCDTIIELLEGDNLKKFAELIVKECAEIALEQKKWVEDQVVFNPRDKEWNLARIQQSQRIVDKIKEHFGVEQ